MKSCLILYKIKIYGDVFVLYYGIRILLLGKVKMPIDVSE